MKFPARFLGAACSLLLVSAPTPAQGAAGDLEAFNANIVGTEVLAMAPQLGGPIYLGGLFSSVQGVPRNNLARILRDGSVDGLVDPNVNGRVWCITLQPDGKVLFGGDFTSVGGIPRNRIARLNADGSLDTTFNPNANSAVYCIALQADGLIVLGGAFNSIGGQTRSHVARVNATTGAPDSFNPNTNDWVLSLAVQSNGKVLLGGWFTTLGGVTRNRIGRVDASGALDGLFNPNANSSGSFPVRAVAQLPSGQVLLGGHFTTMGGVARNYLARVDGVDGLLDTFFHPNPNGSVGSFAVQADGKIVVGGQFTTLQPPGAPSPVTRNRVARLNADGTLDAAFHPNANNATVVGLQDDGRILLGGYFSTLQPNGAAVATPRNVFARLANDPATQTLSVPSASQILWSRGGSAPDLSGVTFELSTNGGASFHPLPGTATRAGANSDWQLTGLSLPSLGLLRARGWAAHGAGSTGTSIVESVSGFAVDPTFTFNAANQTPFDTSGISYAGAANFVLNFAPTPGTRLTVIRNLLRGPQVGAFSNLVNGTKVYLPYNGRIYTFSAWFHGGEGTDFVLLWAGTGVAGWGYYAGLGNAHYAASQVPVPLHQSGILLGKTVVQVARGSSHALALCTDGTVAAWGVNYNGQLGDGTTTDRQKPVAVSRASGSSVLFGKTVIAVAAGISHSFALCSDGTVAAWGYSGSGRLGDGTVIDRMLPVAVDASSGTSALFGKTVVALAAGTSHTLALCSDRSVVGWGDNFRGQLGDNTTTARPSPVLVNVASGTSALFGRTVLGLSAGGAFSLAYCSDGTAVAWGDNGFGQLGDGTNTHRSAPVEVSTSGILAGKTVVAIGTGYGHCLARCSDGLLVAWGRNDSGQVGDGSTTERNLPVAVQASGVLAGRTAVAVCAGQDTSHVLCSDGALAGWGANQQGQVGDGSGTNRLLPVAVDNVSAPSVLTGRLVTSLPPSGGTGLFMSAIYAGQPVLALEHPLGVSLAAGSARHLGTVFGGAPSTFTFTARNRGHADVAGISVSFVGAGAGEFSADQPAGPVPGPGSLTTFTVTLTPVGLGTKTATMQVASNDPAVSSFNLTLTIEVISPTLSATYQTGVEVPLAVQGLRATGGTLALGLNYAPTAGTTLTVVRNLGPGPIAGTFSNLPNGGNVDLSYQGRNYPFTAWYYGGAGHDLVLVWRGSVLAAWGANENGQLGDGAFDRRFRPGAVRGGTLAGKTVVQVARGNSHTLALCTDGTIAAWGRNDFGQLGDGTTLGRPAPVAVNAADGMSALFGKTVVAVAAGFLHSFALCSDGTLVAWGHNGNGRLGDSTTSDRYLPVAVSTSREFSALADRRVTAVAAGTNHSLALCSDGGVVSWGFGGNGQLGVFGTPESAVPISVSSAQGSSALAGKSVTAIDAGFSHSLALCSDGTLAAWGANPYGQLGTTAPNTGLPLAVNAGSGSALHLRTVTSIAAGGDHNLALCSDGTVAAWGRNQGGQLGDNSTNNRTEPAAVTNSGASALFARTVVSLAAGQIHSHALCADGTIAAWGDNEYGQLGEGPTPDRLVPVAVSTSAGSSILSGRKVTGLGGPGGYAMHSLAVFALAFETDSDGDGMNDLAEFLLTPAGFDWQASQPALVAAVTAGLTSARYFTQAQYDTSRTAGQNDVLQAPNGFGLFTLAQVQSINVGVPLLARDGNGQFKLKLRLQKSTALNQPFTAFPFVSGQTVINGSGEVEFTFTAPDNAAFFRLLSQ